MAGAIPHDRITIAERGYRESVLGRVLQLKIFADGYRSLSWYEVWEAFAKNYPGRWAVQVFPPADRLIDGKSVYHLFVCESEPTGLDLK